MGKREKGKEKREEGKGNGERGMGLRARQNAIIRFSKMRKLIIDQFKGWRACEAAWFLFCIFAIAALSVYWKDNVLGITAATTGMAYTVLAGKGKISCFLFGLINTPIYAYLAFAAGYYGDFALNVYYFAMMFPGLRAWLTNASNDSSKGIVRARLSPRGHLLLVGLCTAAIIPLWIALDMLGGSRPLCDSATNVLSVAAMILTVKRAIEQWVLWIAVNAIEVFMWYQAWASGEGHISILLMWLLFLANGLYILSLWRKP